MKRNVCKSCKIFVEGDNCPLCKRKSFSTVWQGRIHFINTEKSSIAQKMEVTYNGEYAIKIR